MNRETQYLIQCPSCGGSFPIEDAIKEKIQTELKQHFEAEKNDAIVKAVNNAIEAEKHKNFFDKNLYEKRLKEQSEKISHLEATSLLEIKQAKEDGRKESTLQIEQLKSVNSEYTKRIEESQQKISILESTQLDYQSLQNEYKNLQANIEQEKRKIEIDMAAKANRDYKQRLEADNQYWEQKLKQVEEQNNSTIESIKNKTLIEVNLQNKHLLEDKLKEQRDFYENKLLERDEANIQAKRKIDELEKTLNKTSSQIQGEAQEKYLIQYLQSQAENKFDQFIGKRTGVPEADIKQIVKENVDSGLKECGVILYESKNTSHFSKDWIPKLKKDGQTAKADILVLVTQAMPAGNAELHRIDDVWICPISYFGVVSKTLRKGLVDSYWAGLSQQNRQEKIDLLYDFMLSTTFKRYMECIIQGMRNVKSSYDKEKQALQSL